jgi:hypothetical protein
MSWGSMTSPAAYTDADRDRPVTALSSLALSAKEAMMPGPLSWSVHVARVRGFDGIVCRSSALYVSAGGQVRRCPYGTRHCDLHWTRVGQNSLGSGPVAAVGRAA